MKTILLCPNQASGLALLADVKPLPTLPVLGEAFVCYWMSHLAAEKISEVRIITSDPVEVIQEFTGDGSRWGLKIEILHEVRDLRPDEARKRHRSDDEPDWAPEPHDVIEADHLPGLPGQKLFSSYAKWFEALTAWLPKLAASKRLGMRELTPGVWIGRRTKIARSARLVGPCWIGDHVQIGKNTVIGPKSLLENQVVIEEGCSVENSWVGPETFLGALAELKGSLAWGNLLINWRTGSHTHVPDPFLLAALTESPASEEKPLRTRNAEAVPESALARRIENVISLAQKLQS
jgi:carbonic anhydrase/acetyltransferase-like protein (isoleucine patch superfamily)